MNIGLLVIGDEILNGKISDLNASWLTKEVQATPYQISTTLFVRDNVEQITQALDHLKRCSDVIITTGGIGPTEDDLTKSIMANYFNKKITPNDKAKEIVISHYKRLEREWTPQTNSYHCIPEDFFATKNPNGLAPGLAYYDNKNTKLFLSAPGVPREFQEMFKQEFTGLIKEYFPSANLETEIFNIRTFGIPEEKIFGELCPGLWNELERFGKVASLPHTMGVDITMILSKNEGTDALKKEIKSLLESSNIKDAIWHYGLESMEEVIIAKAKEKNLKIAFAESCTGGLSASKITDISGSSSVFVGSVVAYCNTVKENILGVKTQTLIDHGAVSAQTAKEMAQGARKCLDVDISISFTGIAGPGGGSEYKPVGTVGIGYSSKLGDEGKVFRFYGDRLKLKERFSIKGLYTLLKIIEEH